MSDSEKDNTTLNFRQFIVQQARKWKIFGNERTTVISYGEEMQLIQYCSASHRKQVKGLFHADPKQSCLQLDAMNKYKANWLKAMIESRISQEIDKLDKHGATDDCAAFSDNNISTMDENVQKEVKNDAAQDGTKSFQNDDKMIADIEKELELEQGYVGSILQLFKENLTFSNHVTVMDLYEVFVKEVLKRGSKLSEQFTRFPSEMMLKEDSSISELESQIYRLLKGYVYNVWSTKASVEASQSEICQENENDAIESTPKTPKVSRTAQRASELTPGGIHGSVVNTPTSSVFPGTPLGAAERLLTQKKFIENIFRCYLHLLVNSRCELALATIFNIPERELNLEAFTHLKRMATSSKLSMYQTMSTFLMRIRLGGQGYAPSSDQPLLSHIKGLGNLYDLLDKLHTVVEEVPQPRSVCRRLVNIIKCNISSCRSGKFPRGVVETVAENVFNVLLAVLESQSQSKEEDSTEKPASLGGSLNGLQSLSVIQDYLDISATTSSPVDHYMLSDVRFSQDTPTRFPSLLSKFRSPMPINEESVEPDDPSEAKEKDSPVKEAGQSHRFMASEALFLDGSHDDDIICTPLDSTSLTIIPSITIVHPGSISKDLIYQQKSNQSTAVNDKLIKRTNGNCLKTKRVTKRDKKSVQPSDGKENPSCADVAMSPRPKKSKAGGGQGCTKAGDSKNEDDSGKNKKKDKSCRRKLMVQVKGQSKITGFLKM